MLNKSSIIRAFFGIPISEDVAQECRKLLLNENPKIKSQVRWTRPGNHHITVRFLGNIAQQKIIKLADAVFEYIQDIKPFQIKLWKIALLPTQHGRLGAVFAETSFELQSLYNAIDLLVTTSDFPSENHAYLPHVTLFRLKGTQHIECDKIRLFNKSITAKELILYQSISIEKGNLYVPLHKFTL